ncbi:hypothetical protein RMCBS344292_16510 [Rhizopus microsporus]|nr:hypothetical protein RMCBS344292_16510 [Rhizopus microsporus]CEJ02509.1 hypothetical protein RMCBS344292_16510 [Rhizopus microsporus]
MEKDVVVAKAKISVEVIAEIINSFTEPISYKTMLFFSILTVGSLIFSNMAIGVYKKNHTRHESLAITHHQHLFNSKN